VRRRGARPALRPSAHRRVILFFCPIRASSWNQISIGLPAASRSAMWSRLVAKFF
jgi:hypothetical protein